MQDPRELGLLAAAAQGCSFAPAAIRQQRFSPRSSRWRSCSGSPRTANTALRLLHLQGGRRNWCCGRSGTRAVGRISSTRGAKAVLPPQSQASRYALGCGKEAAAPSHPAEAAGKNPRARALAQPQYLCQQPTMTGCSRADAVYNFTPAIAAVSFSAEKRRSIASCGDHARLGSRSNQSLLACGSTTGSP